MSHVGGFGTLEDQLIQGGTEIVSLESLMPELTLDDITRHITDHNPIITAFEIPR